MSHGRNLASPPSRPARHVTVIGAGLSGLAAALHLRGTGVEVTVVEAGESPGGLVRTETLQHPDIPGVSLRFDTGATVLTMTDLVVEPLAAVGVTEEQARARLNTVTVDPTYVARYADGSTLSIPHGAQRIPDAVAPVVGRTEAEGTAALLRWLEGVYDAEFDSFIDRNFHHLRSVLDRPTRRDLISLIRSGAVRTLSSAVGSFVDDDRLQRIFTFQALYAGMPPQRASGVYGVIAHMDIGLGVSHPIGGMGQIGAVLAQALVDAGGEIRFRTRATGITRDGDHVRSVSTDTGETIDTDSVIASVPPDSVAALLGTALPRGRRWRKVRHSPSAVVVHGFLPRTVTADWPGHHHTIDFGGAWAQTFVELTKAPGRLMRDPSFLITRPAFSDPEHFATDEFEAVSVLAPCPNLEVADLPWSHLAGPYVAECLQTLDRRGYTGIADSLVVAKVDHPGTWAQAGLPAGTPFGAAHSLAQTGPLRTPNGWPSIADLFLSGAATIPGVGIPPVLVSGRLAAQRALEVLGLERSDR